MIHNLFPVPIYKTLFRELNKVENDSFEKIISNTLIDKKKVEEDRKNYEKNGHVVEFNPNYNFQSKETFVLDIYDDLSELKQYIEVQLRLYVKSVWGLTMRQNISITQSWINVNQKGEEHHLHNHPNSFISGVFYYHCNPNDSIFFKNPTLAGTSISTINDIKAKLPHSVINTSAVFPAKTGNLILFPSWLEHNVKTNFSDTPRISLSFNTQLTGVIGDPKALTYTHCEYNKKFK